MALSMRVAGASLDRANDGAGGKCVAGMLVAACWIALAGCMSVTQRSYSKPVAYVSFAAQEACLTAGCQLVPHAPKSGADWIRGSRDLIPGFFVGQGGETIEIEVTAHGDTTAVTVTSRKRALGFLAQRHLDERVAAFLDNYIDEDAGFASSIAPRVAGAQP